MASIEKRIVAGLLTAIRARREETPAVHGNGSTQSAATLAPGKVREARFSDFGDVAQLKQRWGLASDSFENWERLWRDNPALAHTGPQCPMGWVLEAEGKVVGYLGNILQLYRYGDRTLTSAIAHGLVVEPEYRGIGVSLVAAYFRQKSVDLFISTGAIAPVGKIARAFRSEVLPQADYETVLFWVLQPHEFARAVTRKLGLKPVFSYIGSRLGAIAVSTDKILRRRWPKRNPSSDLQVTEIEVREMGDDFERLWLEKVSERPQLLADRSLTTLRWHFQVPGDKGSACVLRCAKNGVLVGYAVVRDESPDETGLRKSSIADMLVKQDDVAVMQALFAAAYSHTQRSGSHILEILGFPPSIRHLWSQSRPYTRTYPTPLFGYKATDPILHKAISNGTTWYASPFDGDFTLIRPSDTSSTQRPSTSNAQVQTVRFSDSDRGRDLTRSIAGDD